ncbi:hypothetical protein PMAYCL1PPCAC_11684, partial [Pristionchus mayeri]
SFRVNMVNALYGIGDIVICKSNPNDAFGYPAKIQDLGESEDKRPRYQIHYKGWNSRYDIWIEPDQVDNMIFKHTPELEAEHKRLLEESKGKTPSGKKKAGDANAVAAKRRKTMGEGREGSADSSQESFTRMPAGKDDPVCIMIPDKLRALLLDDNDMINRQNKLVKLPAIYTVDMIIKQYAEALAANGNIADVAGNDEMLVEYTKDKQGKKEVVLNKHDMVQSSMGIQDYFNILLGSQLLYAAERAQYSYYCVNPPANAPGTKVNRQETPELEELKIIPSTVYGLSHLVRLFVRIGPMINSGSYGDKSLSIIHKHVTDFMIFLSKNATKYHDLKRDYEVAPKHLTGDGTGDRD